MSARTRLYGGFGVGFAAVMLALVEAWRYNGWDLSKTALFGETVAPIVGVLSLIAVGAAIWSVRVQQEALDVQRQMLEVELGYRRHAALREAYVPFLTAVAGYLDAVREYHLQLLRTAGDVDRHVRAEWQRPCKESHRHIARTRDAVILVDTNEERGEHRWRLSQEVALEPGAAVDTPANVKAWSEVIIYRSSELTDHYVALRESLQREFGAAVPETRPEAVASKESMRKNQKARADAVERQITEQFKEIVRAEAVRSGRWKPSQTDPGDSR